LHSVYSNTYSINARVTHCCVSVAMLNSCTLFTATRIPSMHRQGNIAVPW